MDNINRSISLHFFGLIYIKHSLTSNQSHFLSGITAICLSVSNGTNNQMWTEKREQQIGVSGSNNVKEKTLFKNCTQHFPSPIVRHSVTKFTFLTVWKIVIKFHLFCLISLIQYLLFIDELNYREIIYWKLREIINWVRLGIHTYGARML